MKPRLQTLFTLFSLTTLAACSMHTPPEAPKKAHQITMHSDTRSDPYFWLRERENPAVLDYLEKENEYADLKLRPIDPLKSELVQEMRSRIKEDDQSVPVFRKPYFYYTRYQQNSEYPIFCRRKNSMDEAEEILIDGNKIATGEGFFQFGQIAVSPDHRWIGYSTDTVGRRIYNIYIHEIEKPSNRYEVLESVSGNFVWSNDNRHIFYTQMDKETLRSYQLYRRDLKNPHADELVFEEKDETFDISVSRSKTDQLLFIDSTSTSSAEIYFADANNPASSFRSFHPREGKHEYDIMDAGDRFFIYTNWEAQNFRIMEAPLEPTAKEQWKEVVGHRSSVYIEDLDVFEKFIALEERSDGLPFIRILSRKDQTSEGFLIQYDDPTYVTSIDSNPNYKSEVLRYEYESPTTPESIFEIHFQSQERKLLKQRPVLGNFDKSNYQAERLHVKARDGTQIPVSLVYRKDRHQKGTPQPLLLYGYGSYGISSEPYFSSNIISLLDRGFAYAIAHVRGGSEMGRPWYEDGKLLKKLNTFYDFIDVAEFLIEEKYTDASCLYATGGSAGGLLMGSVINMRPELFKAVVARVPFVDVVSTMLDESIPLTTFEYDEWGNPNDPIFYQYMKSYSPYDNVDKKNYPHLLIMTGLHDSQVQYWEPAKWTAKLRDLKTDSNLLVFKTEMEAGHGGKSGRFRSLEDTALVYSFFIGIEEKKLN